MGLRILSWLVVIVLLLPLASADFYEEGGHIFFEHEDYTAKLTTDGRLSDLRVNQTDFLGEDHHDGYDGVYVSVDSDPAVGSIAFDNHTNTTNSITFNSTYCNLTYIFDDNIKLNSVIVV